MSIASLVLPELVEPAFLTGSGFFPPEDAQGFESSGTGGGGGGSFDIPVDTQGGVGTSDDLQDSCDPTGSGPHGQERGDVTPTQSYVTAAAIALARHVASFCVASTRSSRRCSECQEDCEAATSTRMSRRPTEELTNDAAKSLAQHLLSLHQDTMVVSRALAHHVHIPHHGVGHSLTGYDASTDEPPGPPPCSPHALAGPWQTERDEAEVAEALARHLLTLQPETREESQAHGHAPVTCPSGDAELCTVARALAQHVLTLDRDAEAPAQEIHSDTIAVARALAQHALGS